MDKIHFFSLVPHLANFEGHQYIYHKSVEQALQGLNIEFQALIPTNSKIDEWEKYFRGQKLRLIDFCKLFRKEKKKRRIFFLESFNTKDLLALFLASFLCKKNDQIWLLLRYGPHQMRKSYSFLLRLFKKAKLLTDSELIAESYGKVLQRKIEVMPIPHTEEIEESEPSDKIRCLWPGEPRESKGLKEIQRLVRNSHPAFELMTARHPSFENSNVIFFERNLDRPAYLKMIQLSEIVLLPYDPNIYKESTSGILVEAIIAGKMPLVKEGSWLAYELKKNDLKELVVNWKNSNFFQETKKLFESQKIRLKLNEMQKKYKKYHSIPSFKEKFIDLLKPFC